MGFRLAERRRSAKKVAESRSFSRGVSSRAALSGDQPLEPPIAGLRGLPECGEVSAWEVRFSTPLLVPLTGVKAQAARLAGGCNTPMTSPASSVRGRDGAARGQTSSLKSFLCCLSASSRHLLSSRADLAAEAPCTALAPGVYEPTSQRDTEEKFSIC